MKQLQAVGRRSPWHAKVCRVTQQPSCKASIWLGGGHGARLGCLDLAAVTLVLCEALHHRQGPSMQHTCSSLVFPDSSYSRIDLEGPSKCAAKEAVPASPSRRLYHSSDTHSGAPECQQNEGCQHCLCSGQHC